MADAAPAREAESLPDRFAAAMGAMLGPDFPEEIGLAVSGGGDSMALLVLAHGWAREWGLRLRVATIDHGLRMAAAEEAAAVAEECAALGHPHDTLKWRDWDGTGNLQDAARRARLALLEAWRGDMRDVLFGHTLDDQAETVLMRLKRGSGVEGLSGIAATRETREGMRIRRPLLGMCRAELRHMLEVLQVPWIEDPSNQDSRFDRVQARQALAVLEEYGLSAEALAATAARMARARETLAGRAAEAAGRLVREGTAQGVPTGELLIDRDGYAALDRETQLRLLAAALQWVSSDPYRPRAAPLEALLDRVLSGGGGTLHGCEVLVETTRTRVFREAAALAGQGVPADGRRLWDGRWRLKAPGGAALKVQALGTIGWAQLELGQTHADAPPARAAKALPAVFYGTRLVACPALGVGGSVEVALEPAGGSFVAGLNPH